MSINTTYLCEAWLVNEENEEMNHSLQCEAIFFIKMYSLIIPYNSIMEEDTSTSTPAPILKEFQVNRDYLLHRTSWAIIANMLDEMNIPLDAYPTIIEKINQCARSCRDRDRKIIPMVVQFRIMSNSSTISDAFFNSQRLMFVGASKSAIEALEKVKIQEFSTQCVICMEDIPIGIVATCMPCKHIYHGGCISNWLNNSNCCPLCRSQLPS